MISEYLLQVRFVGFKDRPIAERRLCFTNGCKEGQTEIVR